MRVFIKKNIMAFLGLCLSVVTLFVTCILSWNIAGLNGKLNKGNEIESRMYELKQSTYIKLLQKYYECFNSNSFSQEYKDTYAKVLDAYLSFEQAWPSEKSIPTRIQNCYFDSPEYCKMFMENGYGSGYEEYIGDVQSMALQNTFKHQLQLFTNDTYELQILIPSGIYNQIISKVSKKFDDKEIYNKCDYYENPRECGIDFSKIIIQKDHIAEIMNEENYSFVAPLATFRIGIDTDKQLNLLDHSIIELLQEDLQKHYNLDFKFTSWY